MKKAIIILTTLVLAVQLTLLQPLQPKAVGVDTVVKLVGGKALIRALAEKAGMALSKKQVDDVTGYIQKQSYDGNQKAIDFSKNVNALTGTDAGRSGFKKYVLDPFNWITGLDLIFGAVMAFQQGYNNSEPVPLYRTCENYGVTSTKATWYSQYGNLYAVFYYDGVEELAYMGGSTERNKYENRPIIINSVTKSDYYNVNLPDYKWQLTVQYKVVSSDGLSTFNGSTSKVFMYDPSACEGVKESVIDESSLVNVTNVNSTVINNFDNDTYNQNTTYVMEVDVPDTVNYDDLTPWNEIDPNLEGEIDSGPSEPEEPEEQPVGASWWKWLLAPLKAIGDFITGLADFLLGLLVPSGDSVTGIFNGISDSFKAKLPIADQLGAFFGEIEEIQASETPDAPTFDITMPVEWGGGTFPMIDFSYFDQWRNWILNFIRFSAWFIFLKRLYNRIPKMVY